jgi:Protein of unknown function (DUF3717)
MQTITITQIEQAINIWRARKPSGDDSALCLETRVLADIYGWMIYARADVVDVATLTPEQAAAIRVVT